MRVETTQRQMSVNEVHTHHRAVGPDFRLRLVRGDRVGRLRWACPAGGEVAPGPVGFAGDRLGDRLTTGDPGPPLIGPVAEHGVAGRDISAAFGVCEVFQRARQPQADFSVRVTVMVRLPNGSSPEPLASMRYRAQFYRSPLGHR